MMDMAMLWLSAGTDMQMLFKVLGAGACVFVAASLGTLVFCAGLCVLIGRIKAQGE